MKQRIIIEIDGAFKNEDGEEVSVPPYQLLEKKSKEHSYEALRHFFMDIGYTVTKLELREINEACRIYKVGMRVRAIQHIEEEHRVEYLTTALRGDEGTVTGVVDGGVAVCWDKTEHTTTTSPKEIEPICTEVNEGDKLIEETFKNQERPSVVLGRSAALGNVLQATAVMRERCEQALKEYGADGDPEAVESMKSLIKHFNKLEATIRRKM